ncbi:MAG: hypothetical protein F6K58_10705 [Symploca sp. SIO2E9]|nr:hypothetical protein [Symploca sp. SIO2E9]
MSSVKEKGLPKSFSLDISDSITKKIETSPPVELGDYLDIEEEIEKKRKTKHKTKKLTATQIKKKDLKEEQTFTIAPKQIDKKITPKTHRSEGLPRQRRKQINMSPRVLEMVDKLVKQAQEYSIQKDARASEVFEGLVMALFEAREKIDFSKVAPRGRWGTPTAEAFPIALKTAFQNAIKDYQLSLNEE